MGGTDIELLTGEGCCIECAAKRAYNAMVLQIMAADGPPTDDDELRINLLLEFLETADFPGLRGSDPHLDGTAEARCALRRGQDGKPSVTVIGKSDGAG